jgi:hypothetical protein
MKKKAVPPAVSPLPKSTNLKKDKLPRGTLAALGRNLSISEYDVLTGDSWREAIADHYSTGYKD